MRLDWVTDWVKQIDRRARGRIGGDGGAVRWQIGSRCTWLRSAFGWLDHIDHWSGVYGSCAIVVGITSKRVRWKRSDNRGPRLKEEEDDGCKVGAGPVPRNTGGGGGHPAKATKEFGVNSTVQTAKVEAQAPSLTEGRVQGLDDRGRSRVRGGWLLILRR